MTSDAGDIESCLKLLDNSEQHNNSEDNIFLVEDDESIHSKSQLDVQLNGCVDINNDIIRCSTPKGSRELLLLQKQVNSSEVLTSYIGDVSDTKLRKIRKVTKDGGSAEIVLQKNNLNRSSFCKIRRESMLEDGICSLKKNLNESLNSDNNISLTANGDSKNSPIFGSKGSSKSLSDLPSNDGNSWDSSSDDKLKKRSNMRSQNIEFVQKQKTFMNRICTTIEDCSDSDEEHSLNESKTSTPSFEQRVHNKIWTEPPKDGWDSFCWKCADGGEMLPCADCVRSYHIKCLKSLAPTNRNRPWSCPECNALEHFIKTRSKGIKPMLNRNFLNDLLQFALNRMKRVNGYENFLSHPDPIVYPNYHKFIVKPITIDTLQENITNKIYKYSEEFAKDVKFLLHNTVILNGSCHQLTTVAKTIIKICRQETNEIETCSECYYNANTNSNWFVEVCSKPHILLWAKLKGFPYWPAKAMSFNATSGVNVRFFGEHDRAFISVKDCFLYSQTDPNPNSAKKTNRKTMVTVLEEVELYIANLRKKIGSFEYAPLKMQYDPSKLFEQLELMMPGYKNYINKINCPQKPALTYKIVKTAGNNLSIIKKSSEDDDIMQKPSLAYEVINNLECKNNETKINPVLLKRKADTTVEIIKKKKFNTNMCNEENITNHVTDLPSTSQTHPIISKKKPQPALNGTEMDSIEELKNDEDIVAPIVEQTEKPSENLSTSTECLGKTIGVGSFIQLSQNQKKPKKLNRNNDTVCLRVIPVMDIKKEVVDPEEVVEQENGLISTIPTSADTSHLTIITTITPTSNISTSTITTLASFAAKSLPISTQCKIRERNIPPPFVCVPKPIKKEFLDDNFMLYNETSETTSKNNVRLIGNTTIQSIPLKNPNTQVSVPTKKQELNILPQIVYGKKHHQRARKTFPNKTKVPKAPKENGLKVASLSIQNSSNMLNSEISTNMVYIPYDKITTNSMSPISISPLNSVQRQIYLNTTPISSTVYPMASPLLYANQNQNFITSTSINNSNFQSQSFNNVMPITQLNSNSMPSGSKFVNNFPTCSLNTMNQNQILCSGSNTSICLTNPIITSELKVNGTNINSFPTKSLINQTGNQLLVSNLNASNSTSTMLNDNIVQSSPVMMPTICASKPEKNNTYPNKVGPVSKCLQEKANNMTEFFRTVIEDTLMDMSSNGILEAKCKMLELELETLKHLHEKQIENLKAHTDLMISELRNSSAKAKAFEIANTRKQCEVETMRLVEDAKKKQWCSSCLGEAQFYCCWNTSYCNLNCQEKDWLTHMNNCEQVPSNNTSVRKHQRLGIPDNTNLQKNVVPNVSIATSAAPNLVRNTFIQTNSTPQTTAIQNLLPHGTILQYDRQWNNKYYATTNRNSTI